MNAEHSASDRIETWLESEYCASVAATMLARNEYFELLEDAMVPPARLMSAYSAWRRHASQTEVLGGLVEIPAGTA
jgi:hypothetical protein